MSWQLPKRSCGDWQVSCRGFFPQGGVSLCSSGGSGIYYGQQVDLTLTELHRSLIPECRMQRHAAPHLAHMKKCEVVILLKQILIGHEHKYQRPYQSCVINSYSSVLSFYKKNSDIFTLRVCLKKCCPHCQHFQMQRFGV